MPPQLITPPAGPAIWTRIALEAMPVDDARRTQLEQQLADPAVCERLEARPRGWSDITPASRRRIQMAVNVAVVGFLLEQEQEGKRIPMDAAGLELRQAAEHVLGGR